MPKILSERRTRSWDRRQAEGSRTSPPSLDKPTILASVKVKRGYRKQIAIIKGQQSKAPSNPTQDGEKCTIDRIERSSISRTTGVTSTSVTQAHSSTAHAPTTVFAPMHRVHMEELLSIWASMPMVPSVASRNAWALARGLKPQSVNVWFYRRRAAAKKRNEPILTSVYDLEVGTPPDLPVKETIIKPEPTDASLASIDSTNYHVPPFSSLPSDSAATETAVVKHDEFAAAVPHITAGVEFPTATSSTIVAALGPWKELFDLMSEPIRDPLASAHYLYLDPFYEPPPPPSPFSSLLLAMHTVRDEPAPPFGCYLPQPIMLDLDESDSCPCDAADYTTTDACCSRRGRAPQPNTIGAPWTTGTISPEPDPSSLMLPADLARPYTPRHRRTARNEAPPRGTPPASASSILSSPIGLSLNLKSRSLEIDAARGLLGNEGRGRVLRSDLRRVKGLAAAAVTTTTHIKPTAVRGAASSESTSAAGSVKVIKVARKGGKGQGRKKAKATGKKKAKGMGLEDAGAKVKTEAIDDAPYDAFATPALTSDAWTPSTSAILSLLPTTPGSELPIDVARGRSSTPFIDIVDSSIITMADVPGVFSSYDDEIPTGKARRSAGLASTLPTSPLPDSGVDGAYGCSGDRGGTPTILSPLPLKLLNFSGILGI